MIENDASHSPAVAPSPSLDDLRAQIDQLDDHLLGLLAKRAALSGALRKAKAASAGLPIRPAREVAILRRLLAQAPPEVERELVVEIWRALMGSNVRAQAAFDIVTAGATDVVRQFDLARRHFGAGARILKLEDSRAALTRLLDPAPAVAVLPWLGASGPGGWWPILSETRYQRLGVIAGLPGVSPGGSEEPEAALIVVDPVYEPAGGDTTFAVAFDPHYRCGRTLMDAALPGKELARARTLVLIRLEGFVPADDPRLAAAARSGLDALRVIGCFARI